MLVPLAVTQSLSLCEVQIILLDAGYENRANKSNQPATTVIAMAEPAASQSIGRWTAPKAFPMTPEVPMLPRVAQLLPYLRPE
jgi:hypothetical protein